MHLTHVAAVLCLLVPGGAFAAERPAAARTESAVPLLETVATAYDTVLFGELDAMPSVPVPAPGGHAVSAGVAASLPDVPDMQIPYTQLPFYLFRFRRSAVTLPDAPRSDHLTIDAPTFRPSEVSLLAASPLAGMARRIGAQNFNTEDGSMMYDFAICYRLSKRSSVEVVPGDPAPVKLPVVTMQNNMGVTVGLVVRLSR